MKCPNCGATVDRNEIESTFCGSMCPNCFDEHAEECEVCREDFAERGLLDLDK